MHFKLIIALIEDAHSDEIMEAARNAGAMGATLISQARGEGVEAAKTFLGLTVEGPRDLILMLVEEHLSRQILESLSTAAKFEEEPGTGIAVTLDIEDVIGLGGQIKTIQQEIEKEI